MLSFFSFLSHSLKLYSPSFIFNCSVTTCLHLPETLGHRDSEIQLVEIHPSIAALWLWVHVWLAHACCQLPLPNWNWDASGLCFLSALHSCWRIPPPPLFLPLGLLFMLYCWERLPFPLLCLTCGQIVLYMAKKIKDGTEQIAGDCMKAAPVAH